MGRRDEMQKTREEQRNAFYLWPTGMLRTRAGRGRAAAHGAPWETATSSTSSTDKCASARFPVGFCGDEGGPSSATAEGGEGSRRRILIHTQA